MVTSVDLQAWLETNAATHPPMVTPYVRSAESQRIHYTLEAIKSGRGGTSRITQSGNVAAQAGQPTALSEFSISTDRNDKCKIELTLTPEGAAPSHYSFDCPR